MNVKCESDGKIYFYVMNKISCYYMRYDIFLLYLNFYSKYKELIYTILEFELIYIIQNKSKYFYEVV